MDESKALNLNYFIIICEWEGRQIFQRKITLRHTFEGKNAKCWKSQIKSEQVVKAAKEVFQIFQKSNLEWKIYLNRRTRSCQKKFIVIYCDIS